MTSRPVCRTRQVRDDLRRTDDGTVPEISVNVHELRDHRPAKDSRDVYGVLGNFFRLLKVSINVPITWTNIALKSGCLL
jgi:hypothetical protein